MNISSINALEFMTSVSRLIGRLETDESVESVVSCTNVDKPIESVVWINSFDAKDITIITNIGIQFKMNKAKLDIKLVWDSKNPYKVNYELDAVIVGIVGVSGATSVYTNNFETDLSQMPWDLSGIMDMISNPAKYN